MTSTSITDQALEACSETRALMACFQVPGVEKSAILFFTSLLLRLRPAIDPTIKTIATDGESLLINPEFFLGLRQSQRYGVLAHETYHVAMAHHARRGQRDMPTWNIACDLAINPILVSSGFRLPGKALMPGVGIYESMPAGLSAEQYYDLLTQPKEEEETRGEEDAEQQEAMEDGNDGNGGAGGQEDEQEEEEGSGLEDDQGCGGDQEGEAEGDEDPCEEETEGDGGEPVDNDPGGDGGIIDPGRGTPDECKQQEGRWQVAVAQAAQAAKQMGHLPGWLERLIEQALAPKEDWRAILREFISRFAKSDHSWSRPNRRFLQQGVYLPSLHSEELGDVIVTIDCSGSISQRELDVFAAELQGILDVYQCSLTVLYHDVPVLKVQTWEPSDGPLQLTPCGGGGTSHIPVFNWISERADDKVPCVVCFTDLETEFPSKAPTLPVLWAVHGEPHPYYQVAKPPFGQVVQIH